LSYGKYVQEYQKSAVNGASPVQLVIMLYDGSLRFMEAGKHAVLTGDLDRQNQNLQRAQKIVMELMSCLDMEKGGDIAKNLLALYTYTLNELIEANMHDKVEPIDRAMKVLSDLREGWSDLEKSLRTGGDSREVKVAA
jgi:flagellar secretion chaperone FliS